MNRKLSLVPAAALAAAVLVPAILGPAALHAQTARPLPAANARTPVQVLDRTAQLIGSYDPAQKLRLVFGLKPPHPDEEQRFLDALNTPGSPDYHNFLSSEKWNERFSPSEADERAVVEWAHSQGLTVTNRYPNRLIVDVEAPVVQIQKALGVNINRYQLNGATVFSNDRDPVIPRQLSGVVSSVMGLNSIQVVRSHLKKSKGLTYPDYAEGPAAAVVGEYHADGSRSKLDAAIAERKEKGLTPFISVEGGYEPVDLIGSNAYNSFALANLGHCCNPTNNPGGSPPETSIAIASAGSIKLSDIDGFRKLYPFLAFNVTVIQVDGSTTTADHEGTLDVEWAGVMGNSFNTTTDTAHIYIYEGANPRFSTFLDVYNTILVDKKARVMSTSWGSAEVVDVPTELMGTENEVFRAMTGQGWTLVAAAGDGGSVTDCRFPFPTVDFPASSPEVVAAGGTNLTLNQASAAYVLETAWTGDTTAGSCAANDGGGGGGFSAVFGVPFYQAFLGHGVRTLPDISMNAAFFQIFYDDAFRDFAAGTSIVAPELAGFFAQENAYLLYLQTQGVPCYGNHACAPIGNANFPIYAEQRNAPYAPHYPFYDITQGCNLNDVTFRDPSSFYCATGGYDMATGLGSINMLQLAWAINYDAAGDFGPPAVAFSGPPVNKWYNADQNVGISVVDTTLSPRPPTGVAGFSLAWDKDPAPESFSKTTPGSNDAFYSGPQFPNQNRGLMILSQAGGQGCHTVNAKAWDNTGTSSGLLRYGPLCYDTVPPVTTATLTGTSSNGVFTSSVVLKLSVAETGSGVASTQYSLNGGTSFLAYAGPVTISVPGAYTLKFFSKDVASNIETTRTKTFTIQAPPATATTVVSSLNPSTYGRAVTLTATVTAPAGTTPTGTVTFRNGSTSMGVATLSGGKATFVAPVLAVGSHSLTAAYAGSSTAAGSTSVSMTETVNKAGVNVSVASSLNPSVFAKPVVVTATIVPTFGGPPVIGTVTFKDGTTVLGTTSVGASTNKVTFSTSALRAGSHSITATYNGDANHLAGTSVAMTETVNKADVAVSVASSLNPSVFGKTVAFTATIVPAFGGTPVIGTVTFKNGTTVLGTVSVGASTNKATLSTSALTAGSHSITATYSGDANHLAHTSAVLSQTTSKAPTTTTVVSSLNPSSDGSLVTFTATLTQPAGTTVSGAVTFKDGTVILGTAAVNASTHKAAFATSALAVGSHTITAVYPGTVNLIGSTSAALTQVVR